MLDSMSALWNSFSNWFYDSIYDVVNMLPNSPFQQVTVPEGLVRFLGYVNWIVPFGTMLTTLGLWVTAMATYYLVSAIMRIFKVISGG